MVAALLAPGFRSEKKRKLTSERGGWSKLHGKSWGQGFNKLALIISDMEYIFLFTTAGKKEHFLVLAPMSGKIHSISH
jgi:hypothetical protein